MFIQGSSVDRPMLLVRCRCVGSAGIEPQPAKPIVSRVANVAFWRKCDKARRPWIKAISARGEGAV
jgi:hypothetical protein